MIRAAVWATNPWNLYVRQTTLGADDPSDMSTVKTSYGALDSTDKRKLIDACELTTKHEVGFGATTRIANHVFKTAS